jgi:hypothetical protein
LPGRTPNKDIMRLKKPVLILVGLLFAVGVYLGLKFYKANKEGHRNARNADNVTIGMSEFELLKIMGEPQHVEASYEFISVRDTLNKFNAIFITKKIFVKSLSYNAPLAAPSDIVFYIDTSEKKVVKIDREE